MASQKPKKLSEKALKNLAKSVGAFFLSKGTNDDLIFMGGFVFGTYESVIVYVSNSISLTLGSQGFFILEKSFKLFAASALFLGLV